MQRAAQSDTQDHNHARFLRILQRDERDLDGRLLKAGTKVLFNPIQPEAIREDTPANRQDFSRQDYAWTPLARHRMWFPPISNLDQELKIQAEQARAARNSFLNAVEENVSSARKMLFPDTDSRPAVHAVLGWKPKIKHVTQVADLSQELTAAISEMSGCAPGLVWPDEWLQWLENMNGFKIYSLQGPGTTRVHVIAAALACVEFRAPGRIDFSSPGHECIKMLREIYRKWRQRNNQQASLAFFTLGSALPWQEQIWAGASNGFQLLISSLKKDGNWQTDNFPGFVEHSSRAKFMDLLRPQTRQERIARIKSFVDTTVENGYEGNIHIDMIARETGFSSSVVKEALQVLGKTTEYGLYQTPEGKTALGPKDSLLSRPVGSSYFQSSRVIRALFLLPAAGLLLWSLKELVQGGVQGLLGAAGALLLGFAGEALNSWFQKQRQDQE